MTPPPRRGAVSGFWSPRDDPALVQRLWQIALQQETASLLELRAEHAATPDTAALLRRRAAEGRSAAQRLHQQIAAPPGQCAADREVGATG